MIGHDRHVLEAMGLRGDLAKHPYVPGTNPFAKRKVAMLLAYNEFLFVRVLAVTEWTLPVAISALAGGDSAVSVTEAAAASVSITLPIVIVVITFQKHLVKGLGAGAIKG